MSALPDPQDIVTDAALVGAVRAGERDSFALLVQRHQAALYRYARSMDLQREVAQDLVQESFIRAYTRLAQCQQPDRFRAWLFRILRNLALDHVRDIRRSEMPLDELAQHAAEGGLPFETRAAVDNALASLPALLREAFLLRHQHGYSYEEIAEITGARTSAVKMRVHRAREALRAALAPDHT